MPKRIPGLVGALCTSMLLARLSLYGFVAQARGPGRGGPCRGQRESPC